MYIYIYISVASFCMYKMFLKFNYEFSSWCNLLSLEKSLRIQIPTLTERWESGNYHILFWSMMPKIEFSSESLDQFLRISVQFT